MRVDFPRARSSVTQIGHNGQNYTPGEEMPKYMVLLHDSPEAFANVSPQQSV